eukprot:m.10609 g.10609  ORF g.10609 m.10609 type:complete len:66 (+) comp22477_c0_seq1:487-684(+)
MKSLSPQMPSLPKCDGQPPAPGPIVMEQPVSIDPPPEKGHASAMVASVTLALLGPLLVAFIECVI